MQSSPCPSTPTLLPRAVAWPALLVAALLALAGCATGAGLGDRAGAADIPPDAVETVLRQSNGDTVTQYRVNGQVRAIKVEPSRGVTYYVYDRDGDGVIDKAGDNPPQTYFKLFGWN